jgi:hypothetical protein
MKIKSPEFSIAPGPIAPSAIGRMMSMPFGPRPTLANPTPEEIEAAAAKLPRKKPLGSQKKRPMPMLPLRQRRKKADKEAEELKKRLSTMTDKEAALLKEQMATKEKLRRKSAEKEAARTR